MSGNSGEIFEVACVGEAINIDKLVDLGFIDD
jgi:hypothetical protein